ncbi:MAG TPA: DMT family protein [Pseudobdellovibrionaceae bacterium]|nr:DMT family protein [Pseudobdellovibrionaceae bacterium]
MIAPVALLVLSNVFMTFAWYGHLKEHRDSALWVVILASWGIAFFEYCFQVPANRLGAQHYTLPQLKIIQEVITMVVFAGFSIWFMEVPLMWDYLWAGCCLVGAVYFIFRS